jgi:hypothetical protein
LSGGEVGGGDVIAFGRHDGFCLVSGEFQEEAFEAFSGNGSGAGVTAFEDSGGRFEDESALAFNGGVAGEAIAAEDRQDFLFEANGIGPLRIVDGDGRPWRGGSGGQLEYAGEE